jgi:hypothetical protein
MVTKEQIRGKIEERRQVRVYQRAARGQNAAGALRKKHPGPSAVKEALEAVLTELRLPQPNVEAIDALRHEMASAVEQNLRSATEALRRSGSAAALEVLIPDNESLQSLAEKAQKELDRAAAELNQRIKEITERPNVDKAPSPDEDSIMNSQTIELMDAKLETIEARMDGRIASIEGKIDALLARIDEGSKRNEETQKVFALLGEKAVAAAESAAASADRASGLKSTLWVTSITTILAVLGIALAAYFGTQQSNIGIVQSTIAAFDAGKSAGNQPTAIQQPAAPQKK